MTTYTPGPWGTHQHEDEYDAFCAIVPQGFAFPAGTIAQTSLGLSGEDIANARLIASAPALLEALEKIVADACPCGACCRSIARDVIRAAKGEN